MLLIDSLFLLCPLTELPLLDMEARMDMLDYYAARMEARGTNRMGGVSVLLHKTDSTLYVRLTDVSEWQMELLPDQTIRTTYTLCAPDIPDRITTRTYTHNWAAVPKKRK